MAKTRRIVAIMLDLQWLFKRHSAVFIGIQKYANERGWDTRVDEFVDHSLPKRRGAPVPYDGVIARVNRPLALRANRLGVPVVNVWQSSPARHLVPGVVPDSKEVGRLIAQHLIDRGFRSFATMTAHKNLDNILEIKEIHRVVVGAGFTCDSIQIPQRPWQDLDSWKETGRTIDRWMDRWNLPIGVYTSDEAEGRMVVQACHRRGWRVPADVAMIAGKNEECLCEHLRPTLSSVEIGYDRIGYESASLLDRLMNGEAPPEKPIPIPPVGVVIRESTDFFAVDNPLVASALAFISANSHRPIGPNDVALAVAVEPRTLNNHFHKVLDRTVAAEIRRVRLERAKRELANGKRLLSEIAQVVGFSDEKRLYDVFCRELGISPSDYRKQRQLEGQS